jgi:cardiolipin synthase
MVQARIGRKWRMPGRLRSASEQFIAGNRVQLLTHGEQIFDLMLAAINSAQSSIWFEMYWFAADHIGLKFFNALSAACARGVEVRLIYDSLGSFGTPRSHFEQLRAAGARVVEYNPLSPLTRRFGWHISRRDHRKLLLKDQRLAFVGGLNIADQWLDASNGAPGWRDDVLEVNGPVVRALAEAFFDSWLEAGGVATDLTRTVGETEAALGDEIRVAVLAHAGYLGKRQAVHAYLARLRAAQHEVFIANAYFLPNGKIRRALVSAARRGVDVRIILPGLSDVPLIRLASRGIWKPLLAAGVRIFEWLPTVLHAKTAIVDRRWVTTGSFNLDYISIANNRELNLSVLDEDFAERARRVFLHDLTQCHEISLAEHQARPWLARVLERLLYVFRAWL